MNRRGFLAALLVAPVAAKAATLLPWAASPKVATRRVAGTLVGCGPLLEHKRTERMGKGGPTSTTCHYTRSYKVSAGSRITKVYRDGKEIIPDGDVLRVRGSALYAKRDDLTDWCGSIPHYTFDVA
jgi:hypothetical protein